MGFSNFSTPTENFANLCISGTFALRLKQTVCKLHILIFDEELQES